MAAAVALALWAGAQFFDLADDMREGDTYRVDRAILMWFETHRTPALTHIFYSLTALGSSAVLTILTLGTCVAMLLAGERRFAWTLLVVMAGTPVLSQAMKRIYARERPDVVPHLETVSDPSFPSGHTVSSIAFFVTIALLVAAYTRQRLLRGISHLVRAVDRGSGRAFSRLSRRALPERRRRRRPARNYVGADLRDR